MDAQLDDLRAAKEKLKDRFNSLPEADRKSAELTRDVKMAEDIYVAMLNKTHELSLARAGMSGNVSVIDAAVEPSTPVRPRRALVIALATVLGCIVGLTYVVARRYLSQSVSDPERIEERLCVRLFGTVPFSNEQEWIDDLFAFSSLERCVSRDLIDLRIPARIRKRRPNTFAGRGSVALLAAAFPDDVSTEALRGIRTMLNSRLEEMKDHVVVITSATPATGKTFLATNLALLYAKLGKRVLLVDADLHRGRLAAYFGVQPVAGLAELLSGNLPIEGAIRQSSVANLWIVPAGAHPDNPAELLATTLLPNLIDQFKSQYDLVLFDTPGVLSVTDALVVSRYAGATVLVLRENAQTELQVEDTLACLDRVGADVVGSVFNGRSPRRSDRRGRGHIRAPSS